MGTIPSIQTITHKYVYIYTLPLGRTLKKTHKKKRNQLTNTHTHILSTMAPILFVLISVFLFGANPPCVRVVIKIHHLPVPCTILSSSRAGHAFPRVISIELIEIDRQREGELCTVPEAGILGDIDFRAAGRNIKGAYETKQKTKIHK